ncbi:MAG: hypothetical protein B7W98_03365, partial [Parcubacteria group bacterium 20-58-5]
MRLCMMLCIGVFCTSSVWARAADLPPTRIEVREAMRYVGLPRGILPPEFSVVSKDALEQRSEEVAYIAQLHLPAIATYRFGSHHVYLREDWRQDS